MGNDNSVLSEYRIYEDSYAQVGLWNLHTAFKSNDEEEAFTVFKAKLPLCGQVSQELECSIERLKTLRHPSILKYIDSCVSGDYIHLFVEYASPLNQMVEEQKELDVCSGLHSILLAIDFLHSRAGIIHNNICRDAIFVGKNGEWKLGYFDVSCRIPEVNRRFVDKIHSLRYGKSVPPEDEVNTQLDARFVSQRDMFSYGVLVKETIAPCIESGLMNATAFFDYASKKLTNKDPQVRGSTQALLEHSFFKQPLLHVQDFLSEIPIKDNKTKEEFFRQLPSMLYAIPESIVGSKLATSLLSRIVVLNPIAQQYLLPHVLIPRSETTPGLFDVTNYKIFVLPVVTRIFLVRDAKIRLILLQYFSHYVGLMDKDHLVLCILPELLLGIKDTDDIIVASTLRALADLVPILGSETVIGGTRLKLFTNGLPKNANDAGVDFVPIIKKELNQSSLQITPLPRPISLPERHEPDGGEDATPEKSDDNWSDWEADDNIHDEEPEETEVPVQYQYSTTVRETPPPPTTLVENSAERPVTSEKVADTPKSEIDLAAFEIRVKPVEDEFDYFADMQPTITSAPSVLVVTAENDTNIRKPVEPSVSFNVQPVGEKGDEDDGWNWDD